MILENHNIIIYFIMVSNLLTRPREYIPRSTHTVDQGSTHTIDQGSTHTVDQGSTHIVDQGSTHTVEQLTRGQLI